MNVKKSAGLLMYGINGGDLRLFLVHPGGPYFSKKDDGYWSIPKGLLEENEELLAAAKREFKEETGILPVGDFIPLGTVRQKNNKTVHAWAFKSDLDNPVNISCNTCEVEWPPKSGLFITIPEVDKGIFFRLEEARRKINMAQVEFIDRLLQELERNE